MSDAPVEAVTHDHLLGGRVRLYQPRTGYRAAIDPVLLAAAAGGGGRTLDLGCGVGAAALCLLARCPEARVTGLELQPDLAGLARRNAEANGCVERFSVVIGSALAPPPEIVPGGFDVVMTNPPYQAAGRGTPPPVGTKALAHVESGLDLSQWIRAAAKALAPKGRLVVIHRADRLADLLAALSGRGLGRVRIVPLWPGAGRPAGRVIVTAIKGSRAPLAVSPGLVLHREEGSYTDAAQAILRDGADLDPG